MPAGFVDGNVNGVADADEVGTPGTTIPEDGLPEFAELCLPSSSDLEERAAKTIKHRSRLIRAPRQAMVASLKGSRADSIFNLHTTSTKSTYYGEYGTGTVP